MGLQTASATAMRWIAVIGFAFREHTTGGLRPPLLCRGANVRRRENDFCDAQTYIQPGAAGVSPPWCSGNAPATPILHTFGYTRLVRKQERRASARRGCANRVCNGNAPDFRNRVCIPRTYHGGLTPPALVLRCGRPPARKRFLRCTNARRKERRASARRGCLNAIGKAPPQTPRRLPAVCSRTPVQ